MYVPDQNGSLSSPSDTSPYTYRRPGTVCPTGTLRKDRACCFIEPIYIVERMSAILPNSDIPTFPKLDR